MGLLDYYRQFDDVDQEEFNRGLRERRAREKAMALEQIPVLDLSRTEWPDFPNSEVVNAAIYAARGQGQRLPGPLRRRRCARMLAERHGVAPEQVVVGNGAGELLQSAAHVLLQPGDELVTPWPSYPLYPLMAQRAGGRPVRGRRRVARRAVLDAVGERTRVVVLCNPNDPTGVYLPAETIAGAGVAAARARDAAGRRGLHPVPGRRARGRGAAADRLVPAAGRVPHVLEDLRPVGAARRATRSPRRRRPSCWARSRRRSASTR